MLRVVAGGISMLFEVPNVIEYVLVMSQMVFHNLYKGMKYPE